MFKGLILWSLNIYQKFLRPYLPSVCRFEPNCSEYAKQAVMKYGVCIGTIKAAQRLLRCQPFSGKYGFDPVE